MSAKFAFTPIPPARNEVRRAPPAIDALAGSWRGRFVDQSGNVEGFTLLRDGSIDSSVTGRFLFFSSPRVSPTGVRLLDANDRAFVALIGPYFDPRENDDVVTVLEGVRHGNELEGVFYSRSNNTHATIRTGRFRATRADSAHRAA